ncbi:MAG: N-(5'-phosphoribosyl)anthranilate isomerase [Desulfobacca sp. 4484_104]|nr:MAG: N-(5'-phosphoribosyl)anthranilate isomerase [Desulfobacca sp. 4484_104]
MVRVKICGLTNLADARLASDLGAHALGFIFYPKSPRYLAPEAARDIIAQLPPLVLAVGVFVNEELATVRELADQMGLDWLQLHGEEPPDYCQAAYQGRVRAFLLDTYKSGQKGGTGQIFDWSLAVSAKNWGPVILAGGLNPDNIAAAVQAVQPPAVDVASGVEAAPGRKDPDKLRAFFKALNYDCKENL